MQIRTDLKELYNERSKIQQQMSKLTHKYIQECGDKPLLYITEHAIVRYLERVKGITFDESLQESEKLRTQNVAPETIRAEMLSHKQQLDIVTHMRTMFYMNGLVYVIKGLSVVTVLKDER